MPKDRNSKPTARPREHKAWRTPAIRSVIPSRATAGGPISNGLQEDAQYSIS
ncbi:MULTISPECIES: hypothetical protein [unclassified Sphingopyxis]|uniref:hypothetical protein n=1 Tax=unclassified Sphingopyxis TaxID=2614943 RepID=UPI000B11318D|nr:MULTISPECIES: hypothetical protein [unclassified Sphingopyxis]